MVVYLRSRKKIEHRDRSLEKKSPRKKLLRGEEKNLAATYSPILLRIVPSATRGLTAEFGMGSGVSLSLWPPEKA